VRGEAVKRARALAKVVAAGLLAAVPLCTHAADCAPVTAALEKGSKAPQSRTLGTAPIDGGEIKLERIVIGDVRYTRTLAPGRSSAPWSKSQLQAEQRSIAGLTQEELPKDCQMLGAQSVNGQAASVYQYSAGLRAPSVHKLWIDDARGLPLKLELYREQKLVQSMTFEYGASIRAPIP
jgi:hypothetical protein